MADSASQVADGWEGILDPGETILWQGRPDARIAWGDLLSGASLRGAFMIGFALFWMTMAQRIGDFGAQIRFGADRDGGLFEWFPLFGLVFVAVGLWTILGRLLWEAVQRRRTWYTLTDRAAYIATDLLGRKLDRHELNAGQPLELEDGEPGTVWFAERLVHHPGGWTGTGDSRRYREPYTSRHRVGFQRIPDARGVWRLLRGATDALAPAGADPQRPAA